MQQLAVRLGATPDSTVHWLVWSSTENEIIASGTLSGWQELSSLSARASSASVVVFVPCCDITIKQVSLPPKANRKVLAAIPFMLEDEISGDIQSLHFALGARINDQQQVAVVSKQKMQLWHDALQQAGLHCERMLPDAATLPCEKGAISLLNFGDDLLVNVNDQLSMQGEHAWLAALVAEYANTQQLAVHCYSELPSAAMQVLEQSNITAPHTDFSQLPMQLLLNQHNRNQLNLLQGEYKISKASNNGFKKWRVAASLAAIALSANLVSKTIELNNIKQQRQIVSQQIKASSQQGFPNLKKIVSYRRVLTKEMQRLEQGGSGLSMLVMLSKLGNPIAQANIQPQSLRFDASRTELRMQGIANNFEAFEQFKRQAQDAGYDVQQGAINNQGAQVSGAIVIKG